MSLTLSLMRKRAFSACSPNDGFDFGPWVLLWPFHVFAFFTLTDCFFTLLYKHAGIEIALYNKLFQSITILDHVFLEIFFPNRYRKSLIISISILALHQSHRSTTPQLLQPSTDLYSLWRSSHYADTLLHTLVHTLYTWSVPEYVLLHVCSSHIIIMCSWLG